MSTLATVAGELRAEARRTNERRLLVLHGSREACYESARETLAAIGCDRSETVLVGERDALPVKRVDPKRTETLLGTTTTVAVIDAQDSCRPNALGRTIGTVDGGGIALLLAPPLREWASRHDGFDASLATFPYDATDVPGAFRTRLIDLLRTHPGIAIVDSDTHRVERDGLTDPAPRLPEVGEADRPPEGSSLVPGSRPTDAPAPTGRSNSRDEGDRRTDRDEGSDRGDRDDRGGSENRDDRGTRGDRREGFPTAVYERCLTADQRRCVRAFERLCESKLAVVAEADRGRGKSSAAGLAAGALAATGADVLVTAPTYRACGELFDRAAALLDDLGVSTTREEASLRVVEADGGRVRFLTPMAAADLLDGRPGASGPGEASASGASVGTGQEDGAPDVVFVDEAAGIPVSVLDRLLVTDRIAFATTVHGYEGAGRGFSIRFRERLAASDREVLDVRLDEPIRYAAGDPIEVWLFRALLLDARPALDALVSDADPETMSYEWLGTEDFLADEGLLREVFGLLVTAHYRTEPNDLARLLCAPNLSVRALSHRGQVVSVCLLAREGGLPAERRRAIYEGERIDGHMLPDVLTSQLCDERAGAPTGMRVVRIATHDAVRSRGLGSQLIERIRLELEGRKLPNGARADGRERTREYDWIGVGYGATPELIEFWRANGFRTVHVSTTRNAASGEHSLLMLSGLSERGEALAKRHARWFVQRFPGVLSDALAALDADVARGALVSAGVFPSLDLSAQEWRVVCKAAYGPGLYDSDPRPFRRLALAYFTDREAPAPDPDPNSDSGSNPDAPAALSVREQRLLVRRVFQARPAEDVADSLDYASERQCLRALGDAFATLVDRYGDAFARRERKRYE